MSVWLFLLRLYPGYIIRHSLYFFAILFIRLLFSKSMLFVFCTLGILYNVWHFDLKDTGSIPIMPWLSFLFGLLFTGSFLVTSVELPLSLLSRLKCQEQRRIPQYKLGHVCSLCLKGDSGRGKLAGVGDFVMSVCSRNSTTILCCQETVGFIILS